MLKRRKLFLFLICFLSVMIVLGGCSSQIISPNFTPNVPPQGSSPDPVSRPMANIVLYFPDKEGNYLVAENHKVDEAKIREQPARTAMEMLLTGTKNPNLVNIIPPGTKLIGISLKDGIAYADFNKNLIKSGGSLEEIFIVGSIVNTLTQFPTIKQVQILVEGKKVETISGHMDVSGPLGRSEKIIKK
jgi:spore germination protein GerM